MGFASWPWWAFALLSALFAALTTILAKIGIQGVNSNLATAIRTVVILVIAWGIVFSTGQINDIHSMSTRTWVMLILSGVATGLSWLFYFRALQIGQASYVSPVDKSSTAMVLILSVLILGEQLTWQSLLGTLLIVAGMLVFLL
jgi:transporter family protein